MEEREAPALSIRARPLRLRLHAQFQTAARGGTTTTPDRTMWIHAREPETSPCSTRMAHLFDARLEGKLLPNSNLSEVQGGREQGGVVSAGVGGMGEGAWSDPAARDPGKLSA